MPTKKKTAIGKQDFDMNPSATTNMDHMPRKYREMMYMNSIRENKKTKPDAMNDKPYSQSSKKPSILNQKMEKNETIKQYGKRLTDLAQQEVNKSLAALTKTSTKRKDNQKAFKEKKKMLKRKVVENERVDAYTENQGSQNELFTHQTIKRGLVQQIEAPPVLTAVPKNRSASATLKRLSGIEDPVVKPNSELLLSSKLEKVQPSTIGRKQKYKDLSASQQRILTNNRDEAIAAYRLHKQKKVKSE